MTPPFRSPCPAFDGFHHHDVVETVPRYDIFHSAFESHGVVWASDRLCGDCNQLNTVRQRLDDLLKRLQVFAQIPVGRGSHFWESYFQEDGTERVNQFPQSVECLQVGCSINHRSCPGYFPASAASRALIFSSTSLSTGRMRCATRRLPSALGWFLLSQ